VFLFERSGVKEQSFYFQKPLDTLILDDPLLTEKYFNNIQKITEKHYAAGFLSYELGYCFEKYFNFSHNSSFPLAVFMVFDKPVREYTVPNYSGYSIENLKLNTEKSEYISNVEKIKKLIEEGDIYQANYTVKYKFDFGGSAFDLFRDLKASQGADYNAFMSFDDRKIISVSPELFFQRKGSFMKVKPMKGTVKRGRYFEEDLEKQEYLQNDEKNRSENLMIVDLLRNDLSRVSEPGTVKTVKMFEVEKYKTLFQMTSTIQSWLRTGVNLYEIVKSIFPSGSVTGAPKIRSMEILREHEKEERKVYCGSVGFLGPDNIAEFNVAIRTVLIEGNSGELGVGGGIVYDSVPEEEYKEAQLKSAFLREHQPEEFQIIETMLYEGGFKDLELHLERMEKTSQYFDFVFKRSKIESLLKEQKFEAGKKYKVRILLYSDSEVSVAKEEVKLPEKFKIILSDVKADENNPFLYNKTTNRRVYDKENSRARKQGCYDAVFTNSKGELTEGAITNIYLQIDGKIYTPPVKCGLLNGIERMKSVNKGRVIEKVLTAADIEKAEKIFISNSVIGFRATELESFNGRKN